MPRKRQCFGTFEFYLIFFTGYAYLPAQLDYEEQLFNRQNYRQLQSVGGQEESLKNAYDTILKAKESAEAEVIKVKMDAAAELARVKDDADRLVRDAEEKAKVVVASETTQLQAEFDKRLEHTVDRAKEEAVLAYRHDRARALEQVTTYIDGGKYILGKIKAAFPGQDWSLLLESVLTDDLIDDEHKLIIEEIEEDTGAPDQTQQ